MAVCLIAFLSRRNGGDCECEFEQGFHGVMQVCCLCCAGAFEIACIPTRTAARKIPRVIFKITSSHVVVQLWIDAKWHDAILKSGATHQIFADEPFAMLMAKRHGKSR